MGFFINENTLNSYNYYNGYHTDLYSPSNYTIYDEGVDINYTTLGYEIVAESQQEWNTLMKQVALSELAVYESTGCKEVLYEATSFSAIFNKIKDFFKKLAEKVKAIFHSFMAKMSSVFGKSSNFAKKYGNEFNKNLQNIRDDFEFKGYTFTIKNFTSRDESMFDDKLASIYDAKAKYNEDSAGTKKIAESIEELLKSKGSDIGDLDPTKFVTESVLYEITKLDFYNSVDKAAFGKLKNNDKDFANIINHYKSNDELSPSDEILLKNKITNYLNQQAAAIPTGSSGNSGQQGATPVANPNSGSGNSGASAGASEEYKYRLKHIKGANQLIIENAEEIADAIRSEVAKLYVNSNNIKDVSDSYNNNDFKKELFKLFRNGEEDKGTITAEDIKKISGEIVKEVSDFKDTKEKAKSSTKFVTDSIDVVINKLDQISKSASASKWGIAETGNDVTNMCTAFGTLLSTISEKFFKVSRETLVTANGIYLTALKDRCHQYKNIMVKVIAGSESKKMKNTNESYNYGYDNDYSYGSNNSFLDNVIFK